MDKIRVGKWARCISECPLRVTVGRKYIVRDIVGTGLLKVRNDMGKSIPVPVKHFERAQ